MKILIVSATTAELQPTLDWLRDRPELAAKTEVAISGVGLPIALHTLTRHFCTTADYDHAVQIGIAGSFDRRLLPGSVVTVASERLLDSGAEDRSGDLLSLEDLGFAPGAPFDGSGRIAATGLSALPYPAVAGGTVGLATGTQVTAARILARYPDTVVESMEGAAFFLAALAAGVPCTQLRGVSNYVGPRDRKNWRIAEAVAAVNQALQLALTRLTAPS